MDHIDRKHGLIRRYYTAGCRSGPEADSFILGYEGAAPRVVAMACVGFADEPRFAKHWKQLQTYHQVNDDDIYSGACLRNDGFVSSLIAELPLHYPKILIEVFDWHYVALFNFYPRYLTASEIEALGGLRRLTSSTLLYVPDIARVAVEFYCNPTSANIVAARKKMKTGYWKIFKIADKLKENPHPDANIDPVLVLASKIYQRLINEEEKLGKARIFFPDIVRPPSKPDSVKTKSGILIYAPANSAGEKLAKVLGLLCAETFFNAAFSTSRIHQRTRARFEAIASASRYRPGRVINATFADMSSITSLL